MLPSRLLTIDPSTSTDAPLAISGDTIVVGLPSDEGSSTSTIAAPNALAPNAGAVYVFKCSGTNVTLQAYLKASNAQEDDEFGSSVAIDGDTIVVGARGEDGSSTSTAAAPNEDSEDSGAVYVFTRVGSTWSQQTYLKASNAETADQFGNSVAVHGDTIVVGAYEEDGSSASTASTPNDDAVDAGAAYVFTRNGSGWTQQAYLKASNAEESDWFGNSVAIDRDTIVIGANQEAGSSTSTAAAPNDAALYAGAAYVFIRSGATWSQQAYLKASNAGAFDRFGAPVDVYSTTIVVGAFGEDGSVTSTVGAPNDFAKNAGAAYVFVRSNSTWSQQAYLKASNADPGDEFGTSIAVETDTIVAGAVSEDGGITASALAPNNLALNSGAVYAYARSGSNWTQTSYLKTAPDVAAFRYCGAAVAVADGAVLVDCRRQGSYINLPIPAPKLTQLSLSSGTLAPAFTSTNLNYSAKVAHETNAVTVTFAADPHVVVTLTAGTPCFSSSSPSTCPLLVGSNFITVSVGNDIETRDYVITINRDFAPYVSPSYGPVPNPTSTVFILGPGGSSFADVLGVYVKGIKMDHVVRTDKKIDFTMNAAVAVAGQSVDVVLVKADGVPITFTQAHTFETPSTVSGTTASGAILTTASGVTVSVPPQITLRPDAASDAAALTFTYSLVNAPAEPPGDGPLSIFAIAGIIDGASISTLINPATFELPVNPAQIPPGQAPWLFVWIPNAANDDGLLITDHGQRQSAVGGRWSLVSSQSYNPATGLVTALTDRLGTYVLVTAAMQQRWLPLTALR